MKNKNLKTKIKAGHICYIIGIKASKSFSRTISVEIYLIRKVNNKYWYYFSYQGVNYKVDEKGLEFSYSVGEKVKIIYQGKKIDAKIDALLKPNSNGIKGLSYLVFLYPSTHILTSEKWVFPYKS